MALETVAAQTDAVAADVVARMLRRFPTDAARIVRGAAIAATARSLVRVADGAYLVRSSGGGAYSTSATRCTCPDHGARGFVCKHMWAVSVVEISAERRARLAARSAASVETATAGVI